MKSFLAIAVVLTGFLLSSTTSAAFSEGFRKAMTDVQTKIMLKGETFGPEDVKNWWSKYDEEVVALLAGYTGDRKLMEAELNKQTEPVELMVTEKKGTEIEDIELGKIGAQLHQIDPKTKLWLAILSNKMFSGSNPLPFSTIHFYKETDGKFLRVGALDEMSGPWDQEKIQFSSIQYQPMGKKKGAFQFATFHVWPTKAGDKPNRSQIVWQFKNEPKVVLIVPEVDWHTLPDGTVAQGRGEAYEVP